MAVRKVENKEDIRKIKRVKKTQIELDNAKNKSMHDLKDLILRNEEYRYKNFCYCDFKNVDIQGKTFYRCNFSFSIHLDKAISDRDTQFIECNLCGADVPNNVIKTKCKERSYTDEEVKELFKDIEFDIEDINI